MYLRIGHPSTLVYNVLLSDAQGTSDELMYNRLQLLNFNLTIQSISIAVLLFVGVGLGSIIASWSIQPFLCHMFCLPAYLRYFIDALLLCYLGALYKLNVLTWIHMIFYKCTQGHYYHVDVPGPRATCELRQPCQNVSSCVPRGSCSWNWI